MDDPHEYEQLRELAGKVGCVKGDNTPCITKLLRALLKVDPMVLEEVLDDAKDND